MTRVILGALYPGQPGWTRWDGVPGSIVDIDSAIRVASRAEAAHLDFVFMPEGLRLLETRGLLDEDKITGRPDALTLFAALTAVTSRIGLIATLNSTYTEPRDLLRELATVDFLSGGRAGWNLVTSNDAFTGANFRRGAFLDYADRYVRAAAYIRALHTATTSWHAGAEAPALDIDDAGIALAGRFSVPTATGEPPVVMQAGDSDAGRAFAAEWADAIFSHHVAGDDARDFFADTKSRLTAHGRGPGDLRILPALKVVVADTTAEAEERARAHMAHQLSDEVVRRELGNIWGIDLSDHDPEGPLPSREPDPSTGGRFYSDRLDAVQTAAAWRELARAHGYRSSREVIAHVHARTVLAGTPSAVAEEMVRRVAGRLVDGYILVPTELETGLDEVFERVVPELVERGAFRSEYEGTTLRSHLRLGQHDEEKSR